MPEPTSPGGNQPSDHSAAPAALGYLYQAQLALLELIRGSITRPEAGISVELYDDVAWDQGGTPVQLLQLKHHIKSSRELFDGDTDVWRTLNVWLDVSSPTDPEGPVLGLVTTQTAADGTAMAALRSEPRDVVTAVRLLEDTARTSGAQVTEKARSRFLTMTPMEKEIFVARIFVFDNAPTVGTLESIVKDELRLAIPVGHEKVFMDQLWGWWYARVVAMLQRRISSVSALALRVYLDDLRSQFRQDNLPTFHDLTMQPEDVDSYGESAFIHQLRWVVAPETILRKAVLDYYMAYAHSARWVEEDLIGIDELERFELKLQDEWESAFAWLMRDLPPDATDAQKEEAGRTLLRSATDQTLIKIRERYSEPFFSRGKHHELADNGRIGWHPDFRERLEALLLSRTA